MPQIVPRRKLKSFRSVTKHVHINEKVRRLAEAMNLTESRRDDGADPKVDLNYFSISIGMRLSDEEKADRLADLSDTVTAIGGKSDVVILGMWISNHE
jgi:hypothetical protein